MHTNNVKLTRRVVQSAIYPNDGSARHVLWDSELRGFGLRVYANGAKSYVLSYRAGGIKRLMVLGSSDIFTPEIARREAREHLVRIHRGVDPLLDRRAERAAETVAQLAGVYIEHYAKRRKKSWASDQRILGKDVLPRIGRMRLDQVKRRDIISLLDTIRDRAPTQANRTLAVMRKMFNFAIERDLLEHSPCHHVRAPAREVARDRWLTAAEIRRFWRGLDHSTMTPEVRAILRLTLITGQRPGEICGMMRAELDGSWWTIPAERSKNGLAHRVPLTPFAMDILGPFLHRDAALFIRMKNEAIKIGALGHGFARNRSLIGGDYTPRDLRRTAATWLTTCGIPRLIVGQILNHKDPGITAVYDRASYDKEKRRALEVWSRKLEAILREKNASQSNIVQLRI